MPDPKHNPNDSIGPRRSRFLRLRSEAPLKPLPWYWPLAQLGDRAPRVLATRVNGERLGAELGYEPLPFDRDLFVPVFAVREGQVVAAAETTEGGYVGIEHGYCAWSTTYARLSKLFVEPNQGRGRCQQVRAGEVIGYAAKSPISVRFELWQWTDDGYTAIDPVVQLDRWLSPLSRATNTNEPHAA